MDPGSKSRVTPVRCLSLCKLPNLPVCLMLFRGIKVEGLLCVGLCPLQNAQVETLAFNISEQDCLWGRGL